MNKKQFSKLLSTGAINLFQLKGADKYCLAITGKKGETDISAVLPMLKTGKNCFVFIEEKEVTLYDFYNEIVEKLFNDGVSYFFESMLPWKTFNGSPEDRSVEYEKVITRYVGGESVAKNKSAIELLAENGYNVDELLAVKDTALKPRNWSEAFKNEKIKAKYEENHRELEAENATFDSLPGEVKIVVNPIKYGLGNFVIFAGPTGTGKSFAARIIADHLHAPCDYYQIHGGTTTDDLLGIFVPNSEGGEGAAKFRFEAGPLIVNNNDAGSILVLDELNYGTAQLLAVINCLTDQSGYFYATDGLRHKVNPNFVIIATMNPGYKDTNELNLALKNRAYVCQFPAQTKEEFARWSSSYSEKKFGHKLSEKFFEKLFEFAQHVEVEGRTTKFQENIKFSIRNSHELCNQILLRPVTFEEFSYAIKNSYINHLSLDNDNTEKLNKYFVDSKIVNELKTLYNLYDFKATVEVNTTPELDEFFIEEETADKSDSFTGDSARSRSDKAKAKVLDGFDFDTEDDSTEGEEE